MRKRVVTTKLVAVFILVLSCTITYGAEENTFIRVGGMAPAAGAHMFCAKLSDIIDRYVEWME